jgi:hypothetical protein
VETDADQYCLQIDSKLFQVLVFIDLQLPNRAMVLWRSKLFAQK